VRRTDGASWNNNRLNLITDSFELFADGVKDNCVFTISTRLIIGTTLQVNSICGDLQRSDSSNILTNDPSGPCFLYDSEHFRPEMARVSRSSSFPCVGKRLAGEAPGKESCASESGSVEGADVGNEEGSATISRNWHLPQSIVPAWARSILLWECCWQSLVLGVGNSPEPSLEDFLAERLDFAEGDGFESGPLCGKGESPDSRK
jgi:hypothetical protein